MASERSSGRGGLEERRELLGEHQDVALADASGAAQKPALTVGVERARGSGVSESRWSRSTTGARPGASITPSIVWPRRSAAR
jgi:hypothetical protein